MVGPGLAVDLGESIARLANVRFGSKADIRTAQTDVRFTPNSDRKSRHAAMVMSALPPKADVCGANRHVCFGPKADIVSAVRSPRHTATSRRAAQDDCVTLSLRTIRRCLNKRVEWTHAGWEDCP